MAIYYVWSGAGGSANGSSWANAYLKLETAFSGKSAGDVFYLAHDHAETTASNVFLWCAGTVTNPDKIICVDRAGSVPPVSADRRATAQIAATGNPVMQFASGCAHYDGIIFVVGNSTGAPDIKLQETAGLWTRFDNCSLRLGSTGNGRIVINTSPAYVELNNTTLSFAGTGQAIYSGSSVLKWRNTPSALIGAAVPTTLFFLNSGMGGEIECIGVDLSAAGSGKTIFGGNTAQHAQKHRLIDCKLNASVTKSVVPYEHSGNEIDILRSGASGNYAVYIHRKAGLLIEETTIVRTGGGGASDGDTPIAWKVVTTANCLYSMPFECPPIAIWVGTTGSAVTATVEGIWGGGAVPNDDDVWLDVEYLGDASSPRASFANDGKANLIAAAAGQASSSEAWGGSTTKFKLAVTFTPQQKGWIYARVKCAKASSVFYLDPLIVLS